MGCFPLFFRKNLLSCCQDWMWKWYFVKQTSKLLSFCLILPPPQGQKMLSWPLQEEAAESTSGFRRLFWQSDLQLGKEIIWLGFETKLWIYLHSHTDWIVNPACCQSPKRRFVNVEQLRERVLILISVVVNHQKTQHLSLKPLLWASPKTSSTSWNQLVWSDKSVQSHHKPSFTGVLCWVYRTCSAVFNSSILTVESCILNAAK